MSSDSELLNHIAILEGTCVTLRREATEIMEIMEDLNEEYQIVSEHIRTLHKDCTITEGTRQMMQRDLMVEQMVFKKRLERRQARITEIVELIARLQDEAFDLKSGRTQLA